MVGSKRSRGRPPKMVSPVPVNPPSPVAPPEMESEIHEEDEDGDLANSKQGPANGSETVAQETLIEDQDGIGHKLWVDVISGNRNPAKGRVMQYVAPKVVDGEIDVKIEDEDVAPELKFWETTLILYVLGGDISMHMLKNFMEKAWNFVSLPDMYYHDDGYFMLRFKSHADMDAVLMKGPYTIRNMPLILQEWRPDFDLKKDMLSTIPIWVKLPKLALHLWGETSLNKIGSAIGIPPVTDECTTHRLRVSYARILVEVDITQKMLDEITITDNKGLKRKQPIEYEWRKNSTIGHQCDGAAKHKIWKPKPKKVDPDKQPKAEKNSTLVKTPIRDKGPNIIDVEDGGCWTVVNKSRDKRKGKDAAESSSTLQCLNGFEALGALNAGKLREISSHLLKLQPTIVVLIETRVKQEKAQKIRDKLCLKGRYLDNYNHHENGRLWIEWNDNKGPWCAVGDYNNGAKSQDRVGGKLVTEAEYEDLQAMMDATGLSEMDSSGEFFTWTNKQADNPIYSMIDRILANIDWFQTHSDANLTILPPPHVSDHSILYLSEPLHVRKRNQFRFNNCWVDAVGFYSIVERSWNQPARGTPMQRLWTIGSIMPEWF
ncbi:hypothetical protein GmHk_04G010152 [Glycine max]|nr:hypothetical protein GmHk_04G010152 [Glycine max]